MIGPQILNDFLPKRECNIGFYLMFCVLIAVGVCTYIIIALSCLPKCIHWPWKFFGKEIYLFCKQFCYPLWITLCGTFFHIFWNLVLAWRLRNNIDKNRKFLFVAIHSLTGWSSILRVLIWVTLRLHIKSLYPCVRYQWSFLHC